MQWKTKRIEKVHLQFFYPWCEAGQSIDKIEKPREAATNTKSCNGKEETVLERVKSSRSQLLSSFVPAHFVPISECLKDGSVKKV